MSVSRTTVQFTIQTHIQLPKLTLWPLGMRCFAMLSMTSRKERVSACHSERSAAESKNLLPAKSSEPCSIIIRLVLASLVVHSALYAQDIVFAGDGLCGVESSGWARPNRRYRNHC